MADAETLPPGSFAIAGVHVDSDGYPNVRFRLRALRALGGGDVPELACPFRRPGFEVANAGAWRPLRFAASLGRLLACHVRVLAQIARHARGRCVYVPYPAVFVLLGLSMLPRPWRPKRIVADAFISLYDTIVSDRRLLRPGAIGARLLRRLEAAAYRRADLVLVDTDENAAHFVQTFGTPRERLLVAALAIDENAYRASPYRADPGRAAVRVLFTGTFVPLQGVVTIVRAAQQLAARADIEFTLVGDGQDAAAAEAALGASPGARVRWIRDWQDPESLSRHIAAADICLGIFGTGDKAQRVWPLKNYAYMAVGRAIITADTACARAIAAQLERPPAVLVPPGDAAALAAAIVELAEKPERRTAWAAAARAGYERRLSNRVGTAQLAARLHELCAQ